MTVKAYRARMTIAALVLGAGGSLLTLATTAGPAAGQGLSAMPESGWSTEVAPTISWGDAAVTRAEPQYLGAPAEAESAGAKADAWAVQTEKADKEQAVEKANLDEKPDLQGAQDKAEPKRKADSEKKDVKVAETSDDPFRPDPAYGVDYSAEGQVDVYGAKSEVDPPRPPIEIGRQQYTSGAYDESSTLLGEKNPLLPGLAVYGDWRTAIAYNNFNNKDIAQVATRLNLDVDFKITGTERIHAFFTPITNNNTFTRYEFGGGDGNDRFNDELDLDPQTLFFEGDLGSIYSGFSGSEASFDLPFTVGLYPLFLQNGIWANDAILGAAVSLPAKNSSALGLANFDITFFAAFDNVDNVGIIGAADRDNHLANLYGVTAFIDAYDGYIEAGYGLIDGYDEREGLLTHFLTASYSRRYAHTLSNSTRVFANFGDDPEGNDEGFAIISENSLISGLPSTLLPYANVFLGFGNPSPLVDGNGAGILKNVGINFETDALTGYPKMDDTASSAFGGALGLQYLFNLDQQLVFEVAMVQPFENDGIGAQDAQYGFGVRYQVPIDRAWLFRADATYQIQQDDAAEDNFGIRTEVRRKF
ncbi:MAG: hypothetical protein AB7S70_13610 [Hyphomicrobium sp.]|uniref:hypothetical protein n=1 Tax=Hyphomicrobium sp. TaxID=82 RepID=UPI003D14C26D